MVSARKPTQLNGLSVKYTTLPLVSRLSKILTHYAKIQIHQNLVCLLPWLATNPICHHVAIIILTPPTTLPIVNAPHSIVPTLPAALVVALAVMIATTMIVATNTLPVHTMTATLLATMVFCLTPRIRPIIRT